MRSHRCPPDRHEFPETPRSEYAGYQQTPDGRRVDGMWQTFVCERCGHSTERWQPHGAEPAAAQVNTSGAWSIRESALQSPPPRNIWERPLLLWLLAAVVLAVACYGYYWDSRVQSTTVQGPEIIQRVPAQNPKP